MWCVLEHSHVLQHRALLETNTGGELSLLGWLNLILKDLNLVLKGSSGSWVRTRGTDGSLSQHRLLHLRLLHQELPCGSGMSWKKNRTVLRGAEDKGGCWGDQKVQGSWKTVRRERHDWKGPKDLNVGGDFLCSFRWTERIWAWLGPCQLLITVSRHLSRAYQQEEVSPWIIYTE